jgi:hypothetical protein
MIISKQSSVHLSHSLRSKDRQRVSRLKILWQMNISNQNSVHLLYSLWSKDWQWISWSKITWQLNISNESSVYLFYSLRSKILIVSQLIENNMTDEYFESEFCLPIVLTAKENGIFVREWSSTLQMNGQNCS